MSDVLAHAAYGVYLLIIIGGAALAAFSAGLVRALMGLIASLVGVAGMYLLLQSPFLALMQLLIYLGAVCVLIFFALMFARADVEGDEAPPFAMSKMVRSVTAGVLMLVVLLPPLLMHPAMSGAFPKQVSVGELGNGLLEQYLLPFELISVILLVSMAGGVLVAWDRRKK